MFGKSLIDLVQDVGCDGLEYMGVWEVNPERFDDGLYPCLGACLKKTGRVLIKGAKYCPN